MADHGWSEAQRQAYDRLMAGPERGDPRDRHVLACALALGLAQAAPLARFTGLGPQALEEVRGHWFPHAVLPDPGEPGEDLYEEADLRALLLSGRAKGAAIEDWIAALVARRATMPDHLWSSLGLRERPELSGLLMRHFPGVARLNERNMRWKKFFYRQLCEAEGVLLCKSPICDDCVDFQECFGAEG